MSGEGETRVAGQARRPRGGLVLPAATLVLLISVPLLFATTEALWLRWLAVMAVAWWLPGALLVAHWRISELDLPTAAILTTGLGLCWMVLVALLCHWLPGPIDLWLLLAAYEVAALLLAVALFWRKPLPLRPTPGSTWIWLGVLLLMATFLRLPGIGYHEFHGDEVVVLHRARRAIEGAEDVLARHAKGPGEIAVAMVVYRALGTANEATARLPFALMGIGSVLATALLGRRLFSSHVGFWSGLLLAFNGFVLGLSRIVQYQPAVLLFSVLAVLCAWEFAKRREGRWLALSVLFSGFGVLMHYEFALLAPVLLVLAWSGWKRAPDRRRVLVIVILASLIAGLVVAATYLPGVLNPRFARTQRYLGSRLGGFGAFNIPTFIELGTFYNGTIFLVGLILLVAVGLVVGWRRGRRRTLLLALWFLPFLVLHLFVMQYPGTHFYLFMASWSLLAALPLAALTESETMRPLLRWGLVGLAGLWLAVSAGYLYLTFFRQSPEYVVNYEETYLPLYWAPYGEDVPQRPRYSIPIREGWQALGTLAEWGCLDGTFASNEGSQSLRYWYLSRLRRVEFDEEPDYLFVAAHLQSRHPAYHDDRLEGYLRVGEMRLRDEPRIEIWAREPLPVPVVTFNAEDYAVFEAGGPALEEPSSPPEQIGAESLGGAVTLEWAAAEPANLAPGDTLHVRLAWRPQQALTQDYKVFVHVADESGQPLAQWDGFPCSNMGSTSQWPVGKLVEDHVLLTLPGDMPAGAYQVLVGFYDAASGERLGGRALKVATVGVR